MFGTWPGVIAVVAHQSAQLANAETGFFVHADQERRRDGHAAFPDLADLRWLDAQQVRQMPVIPCPQDAHERI